MEQPDPFEVVAGLDDPRPGVGERLPARAEALAQTALCTVDEAVRAQGEDLVGHAARVGVRLDLFEREQRLEQMHVGVLQARTGQR